jgi:hypothetical protein
MADVMFKDPHRVMLRLRIDRTTFDALEAAYGSQGRALRALREDLPRSLAWLIRNAPEAAADARYERRASFWAPHSETPST